MAKNAGSVRRYAHLPEKLQGPIMLVEVLSKNISWPTELLEEPELSGEVIYGLRFLVENKTFDLFNIVGKEFLAYFEPVINEAELQNAQLMPPRL